MQISHGHSSFVNGCVVNLFNSVFAVVDIIMRFWPSAVTLLAINPGTPFLQSTVPFQTFSGRFVAAAISVMGRALVFVAKIVCVVAHRHPFPKDLLFKA